MPRCVRSILLPLLACAVLLPSLSRADDSSPKPARPRVEVVFCIDTTGSMGSLIAGAQQKIWSIVNGIVSGKPVPEVKVGLVAYRDKSDAYVTQITDLTADLDSIHQKLFGFKAEGGGDHPEHVNQALNDAVKSISWSKKDEKVYRVIFLVGDAPPQMNYSDDVKYADSCKEAVLNDIIINTIRCGSDAKTESVWQEIARKSEGEYTSISQDGGVQVVTTPYDAKLAELSGKLVETGVYAGRTEVQMEAKKAQRRALDEAKEAAAAPASAKAAIAADKSEFRAKSLRAADAAAADPAAESLGAMGMNAAVGKADIVSAYAREGEKALEKVAKDELPEEMKQLGDADRKAFIEKKAAERAEIQKQIDELSKQRTQHIQDELKKAGKEKGFDNVVLKMLQQQGAKKGIEYEGK
ncbi:MAG TPA: vWA domain-containing protein [Planctomycetota bacterium]|nr:vWA domain-containing protein [Planctomycetota bacterium]